MSKKEKVTSFIGTLIGAVVIGVVVTFLASVAVFFILWIWVLIGQLFQELVN